MKLEIALEYGFLIRVTTNRKVDFRPVTHSFCLVRSLSRILREGAEFKINNQEGLVGGNGDRGSESRIQNHERGLVALEIVENPEFRVWTRV